MEKKRQHRSIEIIILMLTAVFMIEVIQVAIKQGFDIQIEDMKKYIENKVTVQIVETLSPNLMFSLRDGQMQEYTKLETWILGQYPLLEYSMDLYEYETAVENEGAYELILKGEANDENFVDENGKIVIVAEGGEEEKDTAKEDETEAKEESEHTNQEVQKKQIDLELLKNEDYIRNTYYTVDSTTYVEPGELSVDRLLGKDMKLKGDNSAPQILIFHTHSQEAFADSVSGDASTTIVGVGEYLTQILREKYKFNVMHNTTTYDLIDGKLDRNKAYSLAEKEIQGILAANPSIEVLLDLHRDAMDEQTHLVTEVNGKPTARFMFFNGMSRTGKIGNIDYLPNPYREDNMSFAFQMQLKAEEYYPGLTRRIYLKGYRYNLHLLPKTLLVEAGAQNNTLEEEKNAMEPLAHMLSMILKGE